MIYYNFTIIYIIWYCLQVVVYTINILLTCMHRCVVMWVCVIGSLSALSQSIVTSCTLHLVVVAVVRPGVMHYLLMTSHWTHKGPGVYAATCTDAEGGGEGRGEKGKLGMQTRGQFATVFRAVTDNNQNSMDQSTWLYETLAVSFSDDITYTETPTC